MFVNRKNKSIFIHNPKAAGTSIRNSFPLEEYGVLSRHRMFPHNPASVVKRNVGEKCWDEYFKYGFVRNPYDRCVSYYFSIVQTNIDFHQVKKKHINHLMFGYKKDLDNIY